MKIKTFWESFDESDYDFDLEVNKFIANKEVIQITTGDSRLSSDDVAHTLTVLYK